MDWEPATIGEYRWIEIPARGRQYFFSLFLPGPMSYRHSDSLSKPTGHCHRESGFGTPPISIRGTRPFLSLPPAPASPASLYPGWTAPLKKTGDWPCAGWDEVALPSNLRLPSKKMQTVAAKAAAACCSPQNMTKLTQPQNSAREYFLPYPRIRGTNGICRLLLPQATELPKKIKIMKKSGTRRV